MDLKSGYPYWTVRDGLVAAFPPLSRDLDCDVAVIGAGITGALIARELQDAGLDVVVLDRRDAGWGSTESIPVSSALRNATANARPSGC